MCNTLELSGETEKADGLWFAMGISTQADTSSFIYVNFSPYFQQLNLN